MRLLVLVSLPLLASGCSSFERALSNVRIKMDQPLRADTDVKSESHFSTPDPGPLVEYPVRDGGTEKVALIAIDGLLANDNPTGPYSLGENPVSAFAERLAAAAADPCVKAVVLRINSPGGGVAATDLMARELAQFKHATGKPVVASVQDVGAGGAYYLAAGCDRVIAIPTAVVGGIGVLFNQFYTEVALERFEVYPMPIKSGDRVDMGSVLRKQSADEKAAFQAMAKEYHESFKAAVRAGRPRVPADSPAFDGRVMSATSAVAAGLVDATGYLPDAFAEAAARGGGAAPKVVTYGRKGSPPHTAYGIAPNRPITSSLFPVSLPGLDRPKLPQFLYVWLPDPAFLKTGGSSFRDGAGRAGWGN
jgi:protease-4